MFLGKRHLLIGLAVCAVLYVASRKTREITAAQPATAVATIGSFERDGHHPGEAFTHASGVRAWGSWSGADDNVGSITLGPFPAPRVLRFGVSGYPTKDGNTLRVELADQSQSLAVKTADAGERWDVVDMELPSTWRARPVRIVGQDTAKGLGGWFAITEPIRGGRSDANNALIQTFAAFAINGLLLGLVYCAAVQWLCSRRSFLEYVLSFLPRRPARSRAPNPARTPDHLPEEEKTSSPLPPPTGLPSHWVPLGAGTIVALCGYFAFWAYFVNALFGVIVSWTIMAAAAWTLACSFSRPKRTQSKREGLDVLGGPGGPALPSNGPTNDVATVLKLMLAIGAFYLALLHLFPTEHDFYTLAANRYRESLPADNLLPHVTAERLFASETLKNPLDEWLSSDRPPLQAGWQLLTWPAGKTLGLDRKTMSGTAAVWFQLLWVAAAYGLLRSFAIDRIRTAGWIAALALSGFFLQNTTYTWPKLSAGAFACGTFGVLLLSNRGSSIRSNAIWSALFAVLAWLSHGGVAFSFLALLPLLAWRVRPVAWRSWLPGVAVAVILASPWLAYQTFYDPPANRLFKWHLAGQSEKDSRGTWETMRDNYAKIGWRAAWSNKVSNLHAQVFGDWGHLLDLSRDTATDRRSQEFFHTGRALTWWPIFALFAAVIARRKAFTPARGLFVLGGWLLLTILCWCLLMFGQYQAVIHHGSYALMIGLFVLFSVVLERSGRGWLPAIAIVQALTLGTTWAVGNAAVNGPVTGLYLVIASAAVLGWFMAKAFIRTGEHLDAVQEDSTPTWSRSALAAESAQNPAGAPHPHREAPHAARVEAPPGIWQRRWDSLRAWWRNPRITLWALAALAAVLAMRKPHALHTPQLWAEDGSIFLMQADLHGSSALTIPYMGYLHTLPRLIAWLAPRFLDPAWWPAFYNGLAFVIWVAVLARLFTARFDLPGKPWLALALIAVPHTGEVFFNITNLQWLTALVLVQQVLIVPPKTTGERVSDLLILAVVTLTGPFGIVFLPLFAWRWWRDRRPDNAAALAVVLLAAAIQAWFVIQTGPRFEFQSQPLDLWSTIVILARRLVVWPALDNDLSFAMPPAVVAALGATFILALIGWSLRPHSRRSLRAPVAAAFVLITLAAVYRTRPDTWPSDNSYYADRYFYIQRVLLAWLLIWEFDAVSRVVANVARGFCVLVLLMHARNYTVRAPIDYHWAAHVTPIRQGVRADIPTLPEGWTLEYRGRPGKK